MARILLAIYPEASREAIVWALLHDVGELATGDLPTTAKEPKVVHEHLEWLERSAHLQMCIPWGLPAPGSLEYHELWAVKLADLIDAWEFCCQDLWMGNTAMVAAVDRYERSIAKHMDGLPDCMQETVTRAVNYVARRHRAWPVTSRSD